MNGMIKLMMQKELSLIMKFVWDQQGIGCLASPFKINVSESRAG